VLGTIGAAAAVPALADALIWEPEWDEFRHIAKKATWALGQVGTEEARLVLQGAAETGDEWVREAAAYELRHWQPGGR
jgi:HEAT repeat protein